MSSQYLWGVHPVLKVLEHHPERILELWVIDNPKGSRLQKCLELAKSQGLAVQRAPKKTLDKFTPEESHQGVVAKVRPKKILDESDLEELFKNSSQKPFFLVLEQVQDPHNLGACLRTSDAAGVTAVIIPKDRSAQISPTVCKVAAGAVETTSIVQVTNVARTLKQLQDLGVWVNGASLKGDKTLYQIDFTGATAIVLGSEGEGLRSLTEQSCDELFRIPMQGAIESLNVSVACGICLYECVRQRVT